ncbi:cytochrome C biogenesis protein CcmF [[Haemophilus] ducreyi]|uniref:Cytochrome c-type biogenesis protein n=2 Tax=Haemophilus ducreyi TaxID=730 RepID=Q7VND5_HAEDU|nr:heme lyase NrfEFG subunit NrfE [[Haemophilus] ducreyi]AAP95545.1 cytochrome c-type biogenesis protein [[Haemophilus] ducreyi 35000HP]AKO30627.1 cytochrome C biogenesis protein CcmF [[Haemophilus] ducreyi]AKO32064.1 cytochrome C biogenesis protein CcmF [[Haemophilus] ducreyi]AKO33520.1 cytochrome C biogenesis protein CcmF [[Haemophilus] ducreyi]AKO34966.1 cytochrome C biogenesis protein CcmF [[Haemophilus] ducreyi]
MLPELGYFSLIVAAVSASLQVLLSVFGELFKRSHYLSFNAFFSRLQALFCTFAFGVLGYAFIIDDFSIIYVAHHSNTQLPDFFKFAASWGGHEGSMLFWLTILTIWTAVFSFFANKSDRLFYDRTLAILGLISLGFLLFILSVSNPFERNFPPPPEGRDLNPMLQDIGLILHPPLLYIGYVGFAVSFAMVVASLMSGVLDAAVSRWIRPWVMISWGLLTAGIILGAWWAYYELGWGGWWFWDPVENASLMPWLLGTALLHSLIVTEQRGIFSYWTILLAIFAFALSLLGTFIVRSGILTSVHAFAVDSDRGIALLILFFSLSFIALALFALKVRVWPGRVHFQLFSKEVAFLLINGLLTVATSTVALGTFYPMIFTAMGWGSISVGAPYFNSIFAPLALLLMSVMGLAVVLCWKQVATSVILIRLWLLPIAFSLACSLIYFTIQTNNVHQFSLLPIVFVGLAIWIIISHFPYRRYMWKIQPLAMRLAHIGFAICVIGAIMNSYYGDEISVRLKPQQQASLAGFNFNYQAYRDVIGPNYTAERAIFTIEKSHKQLATVKPERRYYDVRTMTMAEVGLYHAGLDDVYIVMGDKLGDFEYAFRLHYKPYVSALWLGGIMMMLASFLALLGYRGK